MYRRTDCGLGMTPTVTCGAAFYYTVQPDSIQDRPEARAGTGTVVLGDLRALKRFIMLYRTTAGIEKLAGLLSPSRRFPNNSFQTCYGLLTSQLCFAMC